MIKDSLRFNHSRLKRFIFQHLSNTKEYNLSITDLKLVPDETLTNSKI
jgi:hypothetical protein